MSRGPCLCGDPYCPSCGDPYLAEIENAEEQMMKAFSDAKFSVEEYGLACRVAITAVNEFREALKKAHDDWKQIQIEVQMTRRETEGGNENIGDPTS